MAIVALAGILVVLYTYAVYPLLVALWARLAPSPVLGRDDFEPTVSVCLTVYNGEAHIAAKVRNLQNLDYPDSKLEILVFSDGSTDATLRLLSEFALEEPVCVFSRAASASESRTR